MKRVIISAVAALALAGGQIGAVQASTITLPPPGSAAKVASLVAVSTLISTIPSNLNPSLADVPGDTMGATALHPPTGGCLSVIPQCVFGKKSATKTVVLFGDSHAWMWLAAVNPELVKAGYKLDLLWRVGCVAANVNLYYASGYDTGCSTWRNQSIALIKHIAPKLVIIAERTADINSGPSTLFTDANIAKGLESTISQLKSSKTKVLVLGDSPVVVNFIAPPACLSVHPNAVQMCAIPSINPSLTWRTHVAGESTAAHTSGATFVATTQWLCHNGNCSPIVGNMPTMFDWSHITATYSAFLATVLGAKIAPLL